MLSVIFGGRGQGKTELEKQISYYLARRGHLVLCSDPVGNWPIEYQTTLAQFRARHTTPALNAFRLDDVEDVVAEALYLRWCTMIVDESDFLCNSAAWKCDEGRDIALRGRHRKINLILATQRPRNMHGDAKALADKAFVFALRHPLDLRAVGDWLGPEYYETVRRLPPHHFAVWPDGVVCRLGDAKPLRRISRLDAPAQ